MNTKKLTQLVFGFFTVVSSGFSLAVIDSVTVTGSGSTFVINKIGGFDGIDGGARETAFVAAAQFWADKLVSPVAIEIDAQFSSSLFCSTNSATLGSAGPLSTYFSSGATTFGLLDNVWYPTALINAHYGSDYFTSNADISATFNADIGDADCLASSGWYYGVDGNVPSGEIDFYEVVMHELGHGLGILSLVNSDGSNNSGLIDIFTTFLYDQGTAKAWSAMNNTERSSAVRNTGNLVWSGNEVNSLAGNLSAGVNSGKVQMYAPNPYEGGSSISHFDTALTPNELMEPQYTGGATVDHSLALLKDVGWTIVSPSNVVPAITGQSALSTSEDSSLTLSLSDLSVTDTDNNYPSDFTLTVSSGSNYSVAGNTLTPAANFSGTLTVPVSVSDGVDDSANYNLSVTVNAVNDAPQVTAQTTLSTDEDTSLQITTSQLTIIDPDDSSFTIALASGPNYTVSGTTISPAANYNGPLTVPVTVSDGETDSASFNLAITVNAVNDAPQINSVPSITIDEDTNHSFVVTDFGVSDIDSGSFTLQVISGDDYTLSGNTVIPNTNFNGQLQVAVRVFDGALYSAPVNLDVDVTAINDLPVLTGSPSLTVLLTDAYSAQFSASDIDDSTLTFAVSSGHSWLAISSSGLLSGSPSVSDIGTQQVTVSVSDGLGSDSYSFNLTVADLSDTDMNVQLSADQHLLVTGDESEINMHIENPGPAANVDGSVSLSIASGMVVSNLDSRCVFNGTDSVVCQFSALTNATDFGLAVSQSTAQTNTLMASVSTTQTEINVSDNQADITLLYATEIEPPVLPTLFASATTTHSAALQATTNGSEIWLANDLATAEQRLQWSSDFTSTSFVADFSSNQNARDVLIFDANNDGFDDAVFANDGSNDIYFDNNGTYVLAASLGSANSFAVAAADFNNDGYLDLVFANEGANGIYLNDQTGLFTLAQSVGSATTNAVVIIDANADGWPDIVFANSDDDDLLYLNNGADQSLGIVNSTAVLTGGVQRNSQTATAASLDADGIQNDVIFGYVTDAGAASLQIFQVSNSVFSLRQSLDAGDVIAVSVGDYNGDTVTDIALVNTDGIVQIYSRSVDTFALIDVFEIKHASNILLAPLNDDEKADLIVLTSSFVASQLFLSELPEPTVTTITAGEDSVEVQETTIIIETQTQSAQPQTTIIVKSGSAGSLLMVLSLILMMTGQRKRR